MTKLRDSKGLYWALIATFTALYLLVGFVSTLHSITFFQLANTMSLAILLGVTYEIGQAAVLFSILMSKNSQNLLPWALMILLTALQVTANVYASFRFMDGSESLDWMYWQRSILFWMEADGPETFKVVISWISGALLPLVALGMTALVAENLKLKDDDADEKPKVEEKKEYEKPIITKVEKEEEFEIEGKQQIIDKSNDLIKINERQYLEAKLKKESETLKEPIVIDLINEKQANKDFADELEFNEKKVPEKLKTSIIKGDIIKDNGIDVTPKKETKSSPKKVPLQIQRGWHLKKEYIDTNGDVYNRGIYQPNVKVVKEELAEEDEKLKKVKG